MELEEHNHAEEADESVVLVPEEEEPVGKPEAAAEIREENEEMGM